MFYRITYLANEPVTHLQQEVRTFFDNLANHPITSASIFDVATYFSDEFTIRVNRSPELKNHIKEFFNAYKYLLPLEKADFLQRFRDSQLITELLRNDATPNATALQLISLPSDTLHPEKCMQTVTKKLFIYLYENTLKSDATKHYRNYYDLLQNKYCPFCGIEKLTRPTQRKADYDHLMYKDTYPFMAVNMHNLVPIGTDCNRDFKKTQDILFKNGIRRAFLNPFETNYPLTIDLQGSTLPTSQNRTGQWQVNFSINDNIVASWDDVFHIKSRYQAELSERFDGWKRIFINEYKGQIQGVNILKDAFKTRANSFLDYLYEDSNILRYGLFSFLAECNDHVFYSAILRELA